MSDLIDKIARDRAEKLATYARNAVIQHTDNPHYVPHHETFLEIILPEIASAMREAVRLSGGKLPELQSETK